MQIRTRIKTVVPESEFEKALEQELLSAWKELAQVLNKGLEFVDNFNCQVATVSDTGTADTQFAVSHSLGRIPIYYIVVRRTKAGVVYDSGTAFTTTNIYLKCSVANCNITVIIF